MNDFKTLAVAAASLLVAAGTALSSDLTDILPASGDTLVLFEEVGDWTIYADASRGSCLIERADDLGNIMQMGLTKDQSAAYVGVFTLADIQTKSEQPIEIAVDGQIYAGQAYGIRSGKLSGNYSGGYVLSNDPNFVTAIAEGRQLVAFPEKTGLFIVDLTGTKRAIEEARKCYVTLGG